MSNIEWTDVTWNPVVGCTPVSPGCLNCYAAQLAPRLARMGQAVYADLTVSKGGFRVVESGENHGGPVGSIAVTDHHKRHVFNGTVRTIEERLTDPLGWRKPRRVFVNSMSDLFHESVPFAFIDRVFAVMLICQHHTFQVLTKRPERMAEYLNLVLSDNGNGRRERVAGLAWSMLGDVNFMRADNKRSRTWHKWTAEWPLPNVWLGTSVEDQARAEERIPWLLKCPAAVRFLSCEPLLGALDLRDWIGGVCDCPKSTNVHAVHSHFCASKVKERGGLHWVIVGGESGPNSRPCDLGWVRSIVKQAKEAGVPRFVKQLGACASDAPNGIAGAALKVPDEATRLVSTRLKDRKGGDVAEWPEDLRVREWPVAGMVNPLYVPPVNTGENPQVGA